jgi:hypothetical protein
MENRIKFVFYQQKNNLKIPEKFIKMLEIIENFQNNKQFFLKLSKFDNLKKKSYNLSYNHPKIFFKKCPQNLKSPKISKSSLNFANFLKFPKLFKTLKISNSSDFLKIPKNSPHKTHTISHHRHSLITPNSSKKKQTKISATNKQRRANLSS